MKDVESSNLVVFTGSGVSADIVSSWTELIEGLLEDAVNYFFAAEVSKPDRDKIYGYCNSLLLCVINH